MFDDRAADAAVDRASICQIGTTRVRHDGAIDTWPTHVDPGPSSWTCTRIHGITAAAVRGAPRFADLLGRIRPLLDGHRVYQHSGFDRSAIRAACDAAGLEEPGSDWRDSVQVAHRAWPELKGNDGYGLASLKSHFRLSFRHHDAEEDARAAAEIMLLAEAGARPEEQAAAGGHGLRGTCLHSTLTAGRARRNDGARRS
ncbi:exonuclease domain-containing protein [Mangrovicoccus algicola]|nr:exonuclease domain-containing protein [Mangrovicoccus algicola]